MPVPRLFATGLWLSVTVASTAMVWAATSNVAADVTDRPAPVVAHRDVVSQLGSGAATPATTTTSTTPKAEHPTSTLVARGPAPAPPGPSPAVTPVPQAPAPPVGGSTVAVSPPAAGPGPGAPPTTRQAGPPAAPPTTQGASRPTATYSTVGGVVRVACNAFFIELISATPADGYGVKVVSGGPANVEVHFLRSGDDVSVRAVCFNQPIRY